MQIKTIRLAPKKGRWPKSERKKAVRRYQRNLANDLQRRRAWKQKRAREQQQKAAEHGYVILAEPGPPCTRCRQPTQVRAHKAHRGKRKAVVSKCVRGHTFGNDAAAVVSKFPAGETIGNDATRPIGDVTAFVRVRKRVLKGGEQGWREWRRRHGCLKTNSMSFDLVQAVRINGKPRQKFLCGLGSLKNIEQDRHVVRFWMVAIYRLTGSGFKPKRRRFILSEMVRKGARLPSLAACMAAKEENRWAWSNAATRELCAVLPKLQESATGAVFTTLEEELPDVPDDDSLMPD